MTHELVQYGFSDNDFTLRYIIMCVQRWWWFIWNCMRFHYFCLIFYPFLTYSVVTFWFFFIFFVLCVHFFPFLFFPSLPLDKRYNGQLLALGIFCQFSFGRRFFHDESHFGNTLRVSAIIHQKRHFNSLRKVKREHQHVILIKSYMEEKRGCL